MRERQKRSIIVIIPTVLLILVMTAACQTDSPGTETLNVASEPRVFVEPSQQENYRSSNLTSERSAQSSVSSSISGSNVKSKFVLKDFRTILQAKNKQDFENYLKTFGEKGLFRASAQQRVANQGKPSNEYLKGFVREMIQAFSITLDTVPVVGSNIRSKKVEELRNLFGSILNFKAMEKYVLGSYKDRATPDELGRFSNIYRKMLLGGYLLTSMYSWKGSIEVLEAQTTPSFPDDVLVKLRLLPSSSGARVYVRFRKHVGGLGVKIVDIIVNNTISILATLRGDYSSILQHDGIEALITRLNSKLEASRYAESKPTEDIDVTPEDEAQQKAEIQRQRQEEEAQRLAEIERQRQKEETHRLAEIERQRQEEEAQRLAEIKRQRQEEEAQRLAEIERQRQEEETHRLAEIERQRQKEAEQMLAEAMRQEEEERRISRAKKQRKEQETRQLEEVKRKRKIKEARRLAEAERKRKAEANRLAEVERKRKETQQLPPSLGGGEKIEKQLSILKDLHSKGLVDDQEFKDRNKTLLDSFLDMFQKKPVQTPKLAPTQEETIKANMAKYSGVTFGKYYALVIGSNDYKYLPKLETAVTDAEEITKALRDSYKFEVKLLINASRDDVLDAFDGYRKTLKEEDNLLIYYAGHGWLDEAGEEGYWLPVDAKEDLRRNWVSNADLTTMLRALEAKHVLVMADSCFSGTLMRGVKVVDKTPSYIQRMTKKRARMVITSGGIEPVADKYFGGRHSPFASVFLELLESNMGVMDGTKLFSGMRRPVMVRAKQTPQFSDVRNAGHEGGDFLFVRRR